MTSFNNYPAWSERVPSDVVILGIPYDNGVTGPTGQRNAPMEIRRSGFWPHDEIYDRHHDHTLSVAITDAGDIDVPPGASREEVEALVMSTVAPMLSSTKLPIFLGGDNSITAMTVATISEQIAAPIRVVAFDAHYDAWDEESNHGTWIRDLADAGCLAALDIYGVRAWGPSRELWDIGVPVNVFARELPHAPVYTEPFYVALDIDAIDPAYAPGTGFPEPFGLTSIEVRNAIEELIIQPTCVGMDITEVLPSADQGGRTAALAGRLLLTAALAVSRR